MSGTITVSFDPGMGEKTLRMCIDLDDHTVHTIQKIEPPMLQGSPFPHIPLQSVDEVVEILRVREYRKDLFMGECQRLGALLAERMEDAEGWHDYSRIEPAKRQLATGEPHQ